MTSPEIQTDNLEGCSIALKSANDPTLVRCLESIDDDVSVNVVLVHGDEAGRELLEDREIPYSFTDYGNISKSTEISVAEAEHDQVIVMDSDTWFVPGSIRRIREALKDNVIAKGNVEFLADSWMSGVISRRRHPFNSQPNYATNPGMGMHRDEVRERCRGYIFNPKIRWTEDADLNYRVQEAGIPVALVPDAIIRHEPVTLKHELRASFLYGVGKRLSIENTEGRLPYEEFPDFVIAALKGVLPQNLFEKVRTLGLDVASLDIACQAIYLVGYHLQKRTGRWTYEG